MKDETRLWLDYAAENLEISRIALERGFYNACLQNAQQTIEKSLKALLIEGGQGYPRSHSIRELVRLAGGEQRAGLSDEECDLIDSIYIPSKYPVFGVLPDGVAEPTICRRCLLLAERTLAGLRSKFLAKSDSPARS